MKEEIKLSIVIPAYNEEKAIRQTIENLKKTLDMQSLEYEIIVVDDGSKDKTKEIIKNYKNIILIEHSSNRGYGASLKDGIKKAKYDWIGITDADGTYPIQDIPRLLKFIPKYDMVVGARTGTSVFIPAVRKPAKWFLNKLANYLTKKNIPDLNSGLRIFRKDIAERFEKLFPDGFSFTTTITIVSLINGYQVKFVPINYFQREGKSTISAIRDFTGFTQLIIKLVLYFKPLNFFIPLALFFFILSLLWTTRDLSIFCSEGLVSCKIGMFSVLLFLFSMQILFFGLLADLIISRTKL